MKNTLPLALLFVVFFISVWAIACSTDEEASDDDSADDDMVTDDDHGDDDSVSDDDGSIDDDSDDDDSTPTEPPSDPGQPGPYGTAFSDVQFPDPSSGKDQPLRVYYPSANGGASIDDTNGPRPVVIFGPGFSAPMNLYFSYGEHLASYGYVVLMRNNYVVSHAELAQTTSAIIDWAQEQASHPASPFYDKLDFDHIGTSGHSMGGKISLLTAYQDDRITASATIDPVDMSPLPTPAYPSVTPELMPDIHIPTLLIGGSNGGACAPQADNYHQYFLYANAPSIEIKINNSGHVTFCDLPDSIIDGAALICPTGGGDYEQIRMLSRRYVAAFYKVHLDGDASYDYYLSGDGMASDVTDGLVVPDYKLPE